MATKKPEIAPEFTRTREFIRRYTILPDEELDIVTVWAIGTWTFSPKATNPATYPYLYVTAPKGSGKTVLGQDVFSCITRGHQSTVGATGPALFRMLALFDDETGQIFNLSPTLALDEIDATYSGAKDEDLRQVLNAGYKRGATIPRSAGKVSISYPVYCPKVLMGIDNGHLPDTVTDRSIRIDMKRATPEQIQTIEPFYSFDVEEEALELQAELAAWAVDHSLILRDYRPEPIGGFTPRQWEISRSLVQLAKALGIEARIRTALETVMTRNPERPSGKVGLYRSIFSLFTELSTDRLTSRQILDRLSADGVNVPGNSGKGLASVLSEDGIAPVYVRLPNGHPGIKEGQPVQRGYFMHNFDGAFVRYLEDDES